MGTLKILLSCFCYLLAVSRNSINIHSIVHPVHVLCMENNAMNIVFALLVNDGKITITTPNPLGAILNH